MKSVVTGATGFLGKKVVKKLLEQGEDVVAVGRNVSIGQELTAMGAKFKQVDISDKMQVAGLIKNGDYVFHCAALSSPWGKYKEFYNSNVVGTQNMLQESLENGVIRFVHVSTPSVYFDFKDALNIKESDPLPRKPANDYAKTKLMAENEVRKYSEQGLFTTIIRPRAIFGEGDNAIFPRLIKINDKSGIPFFDDGKAICDLTYVDNVVDSMILCRDSPNVLSADIFNITNGEPMEIGSIIERLFQKLDKKVNRLNIPYSIAYSLGGVAEFVSKITGKEPSLTKYSVGVLAKSQTLDISKARAIGYAPKVCVEEGLERVALWWKQK